MISCKDCVCFERRKWHSSQGEGEQLGGDCKLLPLVLKDGNTPLFFIKSLYVQDTFGCRLGKKKSK
jgi:hypothetical protein